MLQDRLPAVTHHEIVAGQRFTRIELFDQDEAFVIHYIGARIVPGAYWEMAQRNPEHMR